MTQRRSRSPHAWRHESARGGPDGAHQPGVVASREDGDSISLGVNTGTLVRRSGADQGTWQRSGWGMAAAVGGCLSVDPSCPSDAWSCTESRHARIRRAACPNRGCLFTRSEILPAPDRRPVRSRCPRDHEIAVQRRAARHHPGQGALHGAAADPGPRPHAATRPAGPPRRSVGGAVPPPARPAPCGHDQFLRVRRPLTVRPAGVGTQRPQNGPQVLALASHGHHPDRDAWPARGIDSAVGSHAPAGWVEAAAARTLGSCAARL